MSRQAEQLSPPPVPWATPILRWAGSKRKLLTTLLAHVPSQFGRYVEPFAGSACLFFALKPTRAVLGDINSELIHTYRVMRDHPRRLARRIHALPRTSDEYYRIRSVPLQDLDAITRAVHFVYLNRLCFNGVYRTNRSGQFNVPLGAKTGEIPPERSFYRCSIALRGAKCVDTDFEQSCRMVKRDDFVYLDPPYSSSVRPRYGEYGYDSFQPLDLGRLESCLKTLDSVGAQFLLSYADSPEIRGMADKWRITDVSARRHVAGFARHRETVTEVLISNTQVDYRQR